MYLYVGTNPLFKSLLNVKNVNHLVLSLLKESFST